MNYREHVGDGVAWRRSNRVSIENPLDGVPLCVFHEEDVVRVGGTTATTQRGSLQVRFEPEELIPILDPSTGQDTGLSLPQGTIYAALYSMYTKLACVRDTPLSLPGGR